MDGACLLTDNQAQWAGDWDPPASSLSKTEPRQLRDKDQEESWLVARTCPWHLTKVVETLEKSMILLPE